MRNLTAHCLVKNEEYFVGYAIRSVIDFVDQIIVYDTGSSDRTPELLKALVTEYPGKIIFEEKGPCDKERHTQLRQDMVDRTATEWFMVLDGDEIWPERAMQEALRAMAKPGIECILVHFYLCVGDIYHRYFGRGQFELIGQKGFFTLRFIKKISGVTWRGEYNRDTLVNERNEIFFNERNSTVLENKFWHVTHLRRSETDDSDYSSGGTRASKRIPTYWLIGRRIAEPVPEVFAQKSHATQPLKTVPSIINFFIWSIRKHTKNFGQ